MSIKCVRLNQFDNEFAHFEENRMYPPRHHMKSTSTVIDELCKYFELFLFELLHSRMQPVGCGKDPNMRKLNLKHIDAISHAETFIHGGITQTTQTRMRREIEDDLVRLMEVKKFLLRAIFEPGLPTSTVIPEEPKPNGDTS